MILLMVCLASTTIVLVAILIGILKQLDIITGYLKNMNNENKGNKNEGNI